MSPVSPLTIKPVRCTVPLSKSAAKRKNEHHAEPRDNTGRTVDAYSDPRCAAVADVFEGTERNDLDVYVAMVEEFQASAVADVSRGTRTFAAMLAGRGVDVVGIDPSALALDVARAKPHADEVTWVQGVAADLPPLQMDMAFMTANVAQAILGDEEWVETLMAIRRSL